MCSGGSAHSVLRVITRACSPSVQARLLQLYDATEDVRQQRVSSGDDLVLGMNRSDYMLDEPSGALLQVGLLRPVLRVLGVADLRLEPIM